MFGTVGRGCKQPHCFELYPEGGTSRIKYVLSFWFILPCCSFEDYVERVLLPNLERLDERPVVLCIDNHRSHSDTSGLLEKHFEVLYTPPQVRVVFESHQYIAIVFLLQCTDRDCLVFE